MRVGVLGFGRAEIGFEKAEPEPVARLLGEALDAGLNVVDTAECYLGSEELIGRAVAGRRQDFYLFTKSGHPEQPGVGDRRPESLLASIERSLRRLLTDRVDLVQLHSCSENELRQGDVITAFQEARRRGYTRYIGYSGDGPAARYAIECGAFDTLQTSVSAADQEAIDLTLPLAVERNLGVIAKRGALLVNASLVPRPTAMNGAAPKRTARSARSPHSRVRVPQTRPKLRKCGSRPTPLSRATNVLSAPT